MAISGKFRADGIDDLIKQINSIADKDNRYKIINTILKNFGIVQKARVRENFEKSQDPYGEKWIPLKNPSKKRGGSSSKPLLDTGRLVGSVGYRVVDFKRGLLLYTKDINSSVGSVVQYGGYHQSGTDKIPKRPFLPDERGMPEQWNEDILKIIQKAMKI